MPILFLVAEQNSFNLCNVIPQIKMVSPRLQTRASESHRIATIPFYHGIVIILSFCVLDTINFSNNPSFPSLFLNSDDSIRIVMILATICNDSSRNVTILTQNVKDSTEKCQFHPSSFAQLQST